MSLKFCLPIIAKTEKEVLKKINSGKNQYDMFEVWVYKLDRIDMKFISSLANSLGEKLIFVFRNSKGKVKIVKQKREDIINLCVGAKAYVDIDIDNQKEDLTYIKDNKLKASVILSYHNYEQTPRNLNEILDQLERENPTIIKIAAKCESEFDGLRLLSLLILCKKRGLKCIILGMGKMGVITRVFGSLWGNEIIFAPKNQNEISAQGQLTIDQLKSIFDIVK